MARPGGSRISRDSAWIASRRASNVLDDRTFRLPIREGLLTRHQPKVTIHTTGGPG